MGYYKFSVLTLRTEVHRKDKICTVRLPRMFFLPDPLLPSLLIHTSFLEHIITRYFYLLPVYEDDDGRGGYHGVLQPRI